MHIFKLLKLYFYDKFNMIYNFKFIIIKLKKQVEEV